MNQCKSTDSPDVHVFPDAATSDKVNSPARNPDISQTSDGRSEQEFRNTRLTSYSGMLAKRVMDVCLALPVVVLVLPPLAVLVRLGQWAQSPGPLFFRQVRCGRNKQEFTILKFRTMDSPDANRPEAETDTESRIFPIGRILRRSKLDEIPQFVNVLLGTMSVVGPRPHHFEDCENFEQAVQDYAYRTIAKPGITGLAQYTEYRGDFEWNCIESRVKKDLKYIRKWSLRLDLGLILSTAGAIVGNSLRGLVRRAGKHIVQPTPETPLKNLPAADVITIPKAHHDRETDTVDTSRAA